MAGLFGTAGAILESVAVTAEAVTLIAQAGKYQAQRLTISSKIAAIESSKQLETLSSEDIARYEALTASL